MLGDLVPLMAVLAAAAAIYYARERHRRRTEVRPPRPEITLAEAWEEWHGSPAPEDVPAIERHAAAADHPRLAIRAAILESAVLALHLEAIAELGEAERAALLKGYTPGMDGLLQESLRGAATRCAALRHYARLKYDDAVEDDWYDYFLRIAGPYIREKVRLAREYLLEVDEGARRFAEIYDQLLDELRREMLKARPKKRFPPPDLPVR